MLTNQKSLSKFLIIITTPLPHFPKLAHKNLDRDFSYSPPGLISGKVFRQLFLGSRALQILLLLEHFLPLLPLPGLNSLSLMSRVMLTKDKAASTKNSEGINMQEGPPKVGLEVRKGTPKVEPEGEHALKLHFGTTP